MRPAHFRTTKWVRFQTLEPINRTAAMVADPTFKGHLSKEVDPVPSVELPPQTNALKHEGALTGRSHGNWDVLDLLRRSVTPRGDVANLYRVRCRLCKGEHARWSKDIKY